MLEIKSKIIIKKIFQNIKDKVFLQMIKYNNILQKKLDITIEDYKTYNQIEFEIKPNHNKTITINRKEEFNSFMHIFIDDDKNDIKSLTIDSSSQINKLKIIIDFEIKSLKGFFKNSEYISELKCIKFNRKDIKDMSEMF